MMLKDKEMVVEIKKKIDMMLIANSDKLERTYLLKGKIITILCLIHNGVKKIIESDQ